MFLLVVKASLWWSLSWWCNLVLEKWSLAFFYVQRLLLLYYVSLGKLLPGPGPLFCYLQYELCVGKKNLSLASHSWISFAICLLQVLNHTSSNFSIHFCFDINDASAENSEDVHTLILLCWNDFHLSLRISMRHQLLIPRWYCHMYYTFQHYSFMPKTPSFIGQTALLDYFLEIYPTAVFLLPQVCSLIFFLFLLDILEKSKIEIRLMNIKCCHISEVMEH